MNPYICGTDAEIREQLNVIGISSLDDLFHCIPQELKNAHFEDLPPAMGEYELTREIKHIAGKNRIKDGAVCFMGGGAYEHFIPAVVPALAERAEFVTSYTPYQPEASQGNLQVFFEFQSLICRLMEMDVANASMYDGATALAEGVIMAANVRKGRTRCLVAETVHPHWRDVLATYLKNLELRLETLKSEGGVIAPESLEKALDDATACVVVQSPNFFGCIEDMTALAQKTHEAGGYFIAAADPISLGILAPPGQYGADVAVGEGQPLGLLPYYGGETLGIFTCKQEFLRKMPGRLVGLTKDTKGRKAFVLTLQTREQHIRREKATSNICTNHALNATRAAIYLSTLGPQGLKEVAETCMANTHYVRSRISEIKGYAIPHEAPCFKEFTVRVRRDNVENLISNMAQRGLIIGPSLGQFNPEWRDCFLISTTEVRAREEMDSLLCALKEEA